MIERDVQIVPQQSGEYAVWVDGCFKGMSPTQDKAENAAAYERGRPELLEERPVAILSADPRFEDVLWIGIENTGGGLIAAAIYPAKDSPYVWITDAADYEDDPTKPFLYGTYLPSDEEQIWLEHFSGEADDHDLADLVAAALSRAAEGQL